MKTARCLSDSFYRFLRELLLSQIRYDALPAPRVLFVPFCTLNGTGLGKQCPVASASGAQQVSLKLLKWCVIQEISQNPQTILTEFLADIMAWLETRHLCLEERIQEKHPLTVNNVAQFLCTHNQRGPCSMASRWARYNRSTVIRQCTVIRQ